MNVKTFSTFTEKEVLQAAGALERGSEHPLAVAVLRCAEKCAIQIVSAEEFTSVTGKGVKGIFNERVVILGNTKFLRENSIDTNVLDVEAEIWQQQGQTVLFLGIDGVPAAILVSWTQLKKQRLRLLSHFA